VLSRRERNGCQHASHIGISERGSSPYAHWPGSTRSASPTEQRMRALVMRSCQRCRRAKAFSNPNQRAVPRRAPHRKLSAHRRPPIAPALRPPRRQVARCAGAARSPQLSLEILHDFAFPSNCIPRSVAITLNRSSSPGHLQFAGSRSLRAKDRNAARFPEMIGTKVWRG
jgi:hypothetical protein